MIHQIKKLFRKIYKWKCSDCGDILKSSEQRYCKYCSHINRASVKMDKYNV